MSVMVHLAPAAIGVSSVTVWVVPVVTVEQPVTASKAAAMAAVFKVDFI
jgi:hypothetical protein